MTNKEKFKEVFGLEIDDTSDCGFFDCSDRQCKDCSVKDTKHWWNAEYKGPITKNNLGVDCISRTSALDSINWAYNLSDAYQKINDLPSVTPQEPRWIPVSEKKPNKGGEYLLWGKIDENEEEDYCFIGDYHEFDEVFGTEISNYDPKTLGFIDTEIEEYYSVVAWMPLPEPYEPQENANKNGGCENGGNNN